MKVSLTVTAPEGAVCGLYPGVCSSWNFRKTPEDAVAIPSDSITTQNGRTAYAYFQLEPGLYHFVASREGDCTQYRLLLLEEDTTEELFPEPLEGKGYEAGYVMRSTRAFEKNQMLSRKDAWGEAYAPLFQTPWFSRKEGEPGFHRQTGNEEIAAFVQKLASENPCMHLFSLGKSPKYGFDMPLVLFTREPVDGMTLEQAAGCVRGNGKPTVQYCAQVHGSEPASCEGALAMMLQLCGTFGEEVLDRTDVYIIPRINPDGAFEAIRISPTTGMDMNRGYLYMHDEELRMVNAAYNLFAPEVAIDGHERWDAARTTGDSICTDMELQVGAGSLNHPAAMTELAMKMALVALKNGRDLGLRTHFYSKLASAAGGSAGSSYYGTRNSLSFLVETPGQVQLGGCFLERRVLAQYTLASTVIRYTAQNAREILTTVHGSRQKMATTGAIYDEADVIVLEHEKTETGSWSTPLIHAPSGIVADAAYSAPYYEHTQALRSRPRPTAYILPQGLPNEQRILQVAAAHDIAWYRLEAPCAIAVQQYALEGEQVVLKEACLQKFEKGDYVFPNTVPSTILGVIMEPDFNSVSGRKMTLYSMGLIAPDREGSFPLYRHCQNLQAGKVNTQK